MAIARTGHGGTPVSNSSAGTSQAIATTAAVGETIVVAVATVGTAVTTPTDTAGNTYVPLGAIATNTEQISFWGCLSNLAANPTVTAHFTSSRNSVAIETYSGVLAFNQSNTTTNTGAASPATCTLPKALGFGSSWSLAGFANKGTATWSASTGNLRANIAGASTQTPGVAIVDNTTTTSAAAESAGNVWAGTIIELFGSIEVDEDITPMPSWRDWSPILTHDVMKTEYQAVMPPFPPPAHVPDDLSKFDAGWLARQYEDTDTQRAIPPPPPATIELDEIQKFDATGWRALQLVDEESAKPIVPVIILNTAPDEDVQRFVGVTTIYDHTQDTDEPGGIPAPPETFEPEEVTKFDAGWLARQYEDTESQRALPPPAPFAEPGRFALAADEVTVGGVSEWIVPLPPVASEETEFYRQPAIDWRAFIHDDTDTPQFENPSSLAPTTFQEEPIEKYVGWTALQPEDETLMVTEPDDIAATAFQEEPIEKYVGWTASFVEETSESDNPVTPPPVTPNVGVDDIEASFRVADRVADPGDPDGGAAPAPPTANDDGLTERSVDWRVVYDATPETDEPGQLGAPAVSIQEEAAEQKNVDWAARQLEDTDTGTGLPFTPVVIQEEPIEKYAGWTAIQHEDTDTNLVVPPRPTVVQEEFTERNVDVRALQPEDDSSNFTVPPSPIVQQFEESEQKNVDWKALHEDGVESGKTPPPPAPSVNIGIDDSELTQHALDRISVYHEDDNQSAPPPPPSVIQEEPIEKHVGWLALQYEDTDTALTTTPPPPPAIQEESVERNVDTRALLHEDPESQRALPPTPPVSIQVEDVESKNVDWQIKQQEDTESQRGSAPTPPVSIQFEEADQRNVDWKAPHEDGVESGKTPPPPPPTINQGFDDLELTVHAQDAILEYHEDDARALPPPPPAAIHDEVSERPLPPAAFLLEDDARFSPPTPPTVEQDQADDSLWRGTQTPLLEDDLSTQAPTPPVAIQDSEETFWRGWSAMLVEDDWLMGTPRPPVAEQDEISERLLPATVVFDEILAAEKTPPPIIPPNAADDVEGHFHANAPAFQPEDDSRALPPPPPVSIQFEESEQKNVDYVTRQYEDTETQQAAAPPPPVTQIDEISERYVDWQQPWHEDVETARVLPPPPPTADDFDHSQLLQFVPMAIPFDDTDNRALPPPPPPVHPGSGRDDEELQMYREYAGPYYEAIQEQWVWFPGLIYPLSVVGRGTISQTTGTPSITKVGGTGQLAPTSGAGKVSPTTGTGEVAPVEGTGELNADVD